MSLDIHGLVLTYNRRELALRCIKALLAQTHKLKSIIVIDNGSTDGTGEALAALNNPALHIVRIEENIGAARGFTYLLDYAYNKAKVEWGYMMDDDVICEPTAVEELVAAYEHNFTAPEQVGFLVSQAVDGDGRANNVPHIDTRPRRAGECPDWGFYLDQGIVGVRGSPMSGMLMPRTTFEDFGNLQSAFVIWGEDLEYTLRITEQRPGLIVGKSKIVHLRAQTGDISIFLENDKKRVPNFYYLYRNQLYVRRRYMGIHAYANGIIRFGLDSVKLLAKGKLWKAQIALRGTLAGIVFNPTTPYPQGRPPAAAEATKASAPAAVSSSSVSAPPN